MSEQLNKQEPTIPEKPLVNTLDLLSEGADEITDDKVVSDTEGEDLLKEEDKDKSKSEDKKLKTKDEVPDEVEQLIDDENEPVLDLAVPVPTKAILEKYPKLFKDFPYLKNAYYRDQQFTEVFSTPSDAKDALEKAETFDKLENQLLSGDTEELLKAVKAEDQNAFEQIVDNYLPVLQKVDPQAHLHIVSNLVKDTIANMFRVASTLGEEPKGQLEQAATILHQFAFGNGQWQAPTKFAKEGPKTDKETEKLNLERQQFNQERFSYALNDVGSRAQNAIKSTIDMHIDPRGSMSEYVKKNAINDCLRYVEETIASDKYFKKTLDSYWEQAAKAGFSKDSLDKILSTYRSKAKSILPQAISRARNEALKGAPNDNRPEKDRRGPLPVGRGSGSKDSEPSNKRENNTKSPIPKGMKTLDFFNQD